jgi:hypothetical protein
MDDDFGANIKEMAEKCYGYGRWDAPYWFIGLEEGMGRDEDIQRRISAWRELEREGLSDCRAFHFHKLIDERRWHLDPVRLQPTWRSLMLLLMTFLERPNDRNSLREYQRSRWGISEREKGETCVIEISGLAAHNLRVPRERELFRQERVKIIRRRICEYKPKLVVMYGRHARKQWKEIAVQSCLTDGAFDDQIFKVGTTIMVSTPSPTAIGMKNEYWVEVGNRLRTRAKIGDC